MKIWGRHFCLGAVALLLFLLLGCKAPGAAPPPLTAQAAQQLLNSWNPSHCKLAEFYGFYKPVAGGATQVAYVLLTNPGDKAQKPMVYAARFQLLTLPDGQLHWFLTSLISHASGLNRRRGWDNLLIPVKEAAPAAG
jgi:hypothetical protein